MEFLAVRLHLKYSKLNLHAAKAPKHHYPSTKTDFFHFLP